MLALYVSLGAVGGIIVLAVIIYGILCAKSPNKKRPAKIEGTGYVQAYGTNVYDANGDILLLKGVNLGNWFDQECWMAVSGVGNYETGRYTQKRGLEAMRANRNLTDEQIDKLDEIYLDAYITEDDFAKISALGLNCVRIPFTYLNLTEKDGVTLKKDAFKYLDWTLDMCEKYKLYAIVDLHGVRGSQNQDLHSGDDAQFNFYNNEENRAIARDLWRTIALRYKDRTIIAGYDLLNETRRAPGKYTGKAQFDYYNELYKAIREVDQNHMLIVECFTFPTHGVNGKKYGWENVCYSYHIYNLMPISQKPCLYFYKALHNLMGYKFPVFIGEFSCWNNKKEWHISFDFFEKLGWSYVSWTYKTNCNLYKNDKKRNMWGLYELDIPPVDLSTATYDEIAAVWGATGTENAKATLIYDAYKEVAERKSE